MSCDLYVSALDLDRLGSVKGSRDEILLATIIERNRDCIAAHDEYFRVFPGVVQYVPLADAVAQIFRQSIDANIEPRFQFEHAVALIADTMGELLDAGCFAESRASFWIEVDAVICRRLLAADRPCRDWPKLAEVLKRGPFIDIPCDHEHALGSGYLKAEEVLVASSAAALCDLERPDSTLDDLQWPDEALDAAKQYRDWLRHASANGLGLYFHA